MKGWCLPALKRALVKLLELITHRPELHPRDVDFSGVKRILVIRPHDMMGDFLLSTPVFRAIRSKFPEVCLGVLVRNEFVDILINNPHVDEILVLQKSPTQWNPRSILILLKRLFRKWDLTIVLNTVSHSLSSDVFAQISGSRISLGTSARTFQGCSRNFFYNLQAPDHAGPRHQTDRNLDIVRYIGADTTDRSELMSLYESECRAAESKLLTLGIHPGPPVIAMHLGAGKPKNRWPPDRFAQLANRLHDQVKAEVIVCWGPHEADLVTEFLHHVDFEVIQIPPGGVRQLAAIFTRCQFVICNDTGIMHLCASMGVPLLAIFGPTDPSEWKPIGDSFVAIRGDDGTVESVAVDNVFQTASTMIKKFRDA